MLTFWSTVLVTYTYIMYIRISSCQDFMFIVHARCYGGHVCHLRYMVQIGKWPILPWWWPCTIWMKVTLIASIIHICGIPYMCIYISYSRIVYVPHLCIYISYSRIVSVPRPVPHDFIIVSNFQPRQLDIFRKLRLTTFIELN